MSLAVGQSSRRQLIAGGEHHGDPQSLGIGQHPLHRIACRLGPEFLGAAPTDRKHLRPIDVVEDRLVDRADQVLVELAAK